jgi:hypothetical protein
MAKGTKYDHWINEVVERSLKAAKNFDRLNQEQTDRITKAVYEAGFNHRMKLAEMAFCDEYPAHCIPEYKLLHGTSTW